MHPSGFNDFFFSLPFSQASRPLVCRPLETKTNQTKISISSDAAAAPNDPDDTVFRILISSDNHLGAWEKDEIRKQDSFAAFDEVFQLATSHGADIVLLGGDLFHDNRPSRATVVKAMSTLSKHCMVRPKQGMRGAAAAAAASGYEFDDRAFDGGDGGDGGGNAAAVGGNDEGPKVSIVNRVDGLLAG